MTSKKDKPDDDVFLCKQCGECCKGYGGTYVTPQDVSAIARYIQVTEEELLENYCRLSGSRPLLAQKENGFCIFWDKLCTIHPVKPRMCKAWPFIPAVIVEPANWEIMAGSCPGIRTDVSADDLKKIVAKKIQEMDHEKK